MSSFELLAPRKNWSDLVVNSIDANSVNSPSITTTGRIRQDDNRLTPVALWACTGNFSTSNTTPTFAMGTFVGPVDIPADAVYNSMSTRIIVSGSLSTPGANTTTFSIRNLAGTYIHASVGALVGGPTTQDVNVEFNIQVPTPGGPGTGFQRSVGIASVSTGTTLVNTISDNTTFDSTNGVQYYLYIHHSAPGSTFIRKLAYANLMI